jgi:ABC-type sugar transport system ATPase subunit
VDLGFRPQDASICAADEADGTGTVAVVEPLGHHTLVHLDPSQAPAARVRLVVPIDLDVRAGDRLAFRVRRDRLHLFDTVSGVRLH